MRIYHQSCSFYFILIHLPSIKGDLCHFRLPWLVNYLSFLPCYLNFVLHLNNLPKSLVHTPAANSVAGCLRESKGILHTWHGFSFAHVAMETPLFLSIYWRSNWIISYGRCECAICISNSRGSEDHNHQSIKIRLVKYGAHYFAVVVEASESLFTKLKKMSFSFSSFLRTIFFKCWKFLVSP